MKTLQLYSGESVIVDDDDYLIFSKHKWQLSPTKYVARSAYSNGKRRRVYLHRLIMGNPVGLVVDHINKNKLDNRKANLRVCTQKQNVNAGRGWSKSEIKYKGVSYMSSGGKKVLTKFRARINNIHIGTFNSPEEAAKAVDMKAKELNGEYAYLNFPD